MKAERWTRIEEILSGALEQRAGRRHAYLERECAGDRDLRREVESLLAEHDRDNGFLDTAPPWTPVRELERDADPETIGPYRVVRVLGRGGMGRVYLAEREAPGFRQQVAVKLMRRGLDTDDLVARFRNERQILARLNHPNIARLFDVGATEDGLPYFVMEYVEGDPMHDYCDRHRLTIPERLRLFLTVCAAVQHAHRNLIVHRDLKPSNILVTAEGVPKLLDFGIAKILATAEDDTSQPLTRAELRLLTPEHAAPEQIRGDAVTTACDVYALGILLYQLLAGRHPYARAEGSERELDRLIHEIDPPAPSAVVTAAETGTAGARGVTPGPLRRQLSGDLDTIVLAAMRKEPEARYASVLSLAEDIERHLDGRLVEARPATTGYRLRKFVGRNRLAVGAASILFLVLSAATGITLYQSALIRAESARVARERDKALEVRTFLLETFSTTGPDQATGDTVTARQLLDRHAASLDDAYADDDEMRAEMMSVLAEGYEKLGLFEVAEPFARGALELRSALFGAGHPDVGVSHNVLGWLLRQRGDIDGAEAHLREAVGALRRAFPEGDGRLARALNDMALIASLRGNRDEAVSLLRESIDMRRRVLGAEHVGVAIATSNLAAVFYESGDLDDAVRESESALDLFRRTLGPDHQRTLIVQTNLATFLSSRGDHEASAEQHRDILERRRRLFGPRHASVASSLTLLGSALHLLGRSNEGEPLLQEALSIQREAGIRTEEIVTTLRVLGDAQVRMAQPAAAQASYREALALTRASMGNDHSTVALLLSRSGHAQELLGDLRSAERVHRDAIDISTRVSGPHHRWTIEIRFAYATFLLHQERRPEVETQLDEIEKSLDATGVASDAPVRTRLRNARSIVAS